MLAATALVIVVGALGFGVLVWTDDRVNKARSLRRHRRADRTHQRLRRQGAESLTLIAQGSGQAYEDRYKAVIRNTKNTLAGLTTAQTGPGGGTAAAWRTDASMLRSVPPTTGTGCGGEEQPDRVTRIAHCGVRDRVGRRARQARGPTRTTSATPGANCWRSHFCPRRHRRRIPRVGESRTCRSTGDAARATGRGRRCGVLLAIASAACSSSKSSSADAPRRHRPRYRRAHAARARLRRPGGVVRPMARAGPGHAGRVVHRRSSNAGASSPVSRPTRCCSGSHPFNGNLEGFDIDMVRRMAAEARRPNRSSSG